WVTSVGGTTREDPEVTASISGRGFSNCFPRPLYQDNAVAHPTSSRKRPTTELPTR
ncbi:hypothetical protein BJY52DRAFT_1126047, partial [Lactarius psammicola]